MDIQKKLPFLRSALKTKKKACKEKQPTLIDSWAPVWCITHHPTTSLRELGLLQSVVRSQPLGPRDSHSLLCGFWLIRDWPEAVRTTPFQLRCGVWGLWRQMIQSVRLSQHRWEQRPDVLLRVTNLQAEGNPALGSYLVTASSLLDENCFPPFAFLV